MRGVIFRGDREIEIREMPDPKPGPGEVVIDIKASGLCGSDFQGGYRVPKAERGDPQSLKVGGHEPCGVIAEVGEGVSTVKAGDRVMMHHYTGCRTCKMCRIGYTQMCIHHHETYGRTENGGHEDFLLVPDYTCVPLPDEMSFAEGAACACGTGTAFHAVKRLGHIRHGHHSRLRPGAGRTERHAVRRPNGGQGTGGRRGPGTVGTCQATGG